ncbi:RHS repeat-associated core domain-containing protein [Kitasatospora sp. NPDC087315]|uniref:RHS repeat-associated core domain-containing protein n=1 Tax=Kitasatospora sp. NPDC087315 TaxID=3364069 RepID=UPI00380CD0F1
MSTLVLLSALVPPLAPAALAADGGKDEDRIWSPPNTPLQRTSSVPGSADQPKSAAPKTGSPDWQPPKDRPKLRTGSASVTLDAPPAAGSKSAQADASGAQVPEPAAGTPRQVGELPVWLAPVAPTGGTRGDAGKGTPVKVTVAEEETAAAAGLPGGLLVSLTRSDTGSVAAPAAGGSAADAGASADDEAAADETGDTVRVAIDLGGIGYGGDFADRARLVTLPACATTTPEAAGCLTRTPVVSRYDVQAKKLIADVRLPRTDAAPRGPQTKSSEAAAPTPLLLAVEATPSSGKGTYSATPLSPSAAWTAGGSSGSFSYSYPVQSPPTLGGSAPAVALGYDSASVDGRMASTNSQASWIGDGWDLNSGFVERSYKPCDKAGIAGSGDSCWAGANLTLSLGSHSGELVPHDASCVNGDAAFEQSKCTWRPKNDDGTKVEFLKGATNGTWNGSYLKVTDTSGTVYYFGLNHLPAADGSPTTLGAENKSVYTVPVYSPNAGDPCYDAAKGKASWCRTAWRWNLDHVVDVHGNLTTYTYAPETNWYARGGGQNGGTGANTDYTRAGTLATIAYGQRLTDQIAANGTHQPASKIEFQTGERCDAGTDACKTENRTPANAADWPDVPLDKNCAQTGICTNYGPSYWSTRWLNAITTSIRSGGGYRPVDRYELKHVFKTPQNAGENHRIPWLQSVKRIGKDTYDGQTEQALPEVTFADILLPNRVDGLTPARPRYNRPRMDTVTTETGGTILVGYHQDSCSRTANRMPASADTDTLSCYNVKWFDTALQVPVDDWFLRYPVASVTTDPNSNLVQGSVAKVVSYSYGNAAWHRNDSPLVENDYRTWDQFRGYAAVTAVTGAPNDPAETKSKTVTTYHQGMDDDLKASGTRSVSVAGPKSGARTDHDWLSGKALETDVYPHAGASAPLSWTVNVSEGEKETAVHARGGLPALKARYASKKSTGTSTAVTTTGTRSTTTVVESDQDNGNRVTTSLSTADGTPDVCTRNAYAASAGNPQLTGLLSEVLTVSGANACTATAAAANTVSGVRTLFDGLAYRSAGAKGNPTGAQVLDGYNGAGAPQWTNTGTTGFDDYGRIVSVTDVTTSDPKNPTGAVTTTTYSAANTGELTNRTVTGTPAPAGTPDEGIARTTTVQLNPARSLPLTTTDPNGRTVTQKYDGLGRQTQVWTPGRSPGADANLTFTYEVNDTTKPSAVTSRSLRPNGSYAVSTQIVDGLGRPVQTQEDPAVSSYHGRMVTDTFYDSHGRNNRTYNTYYEDTNAPTTVRWIPNGAAVPNQSVTTFDGLDRPVSAQFIALGVLQNTTATVYPGADRVDVSPPSGYTATSTVTDTRGRTTQLWQYRTPSATGNQADAEVTSYTFTASGQNATRVDAAGNTWSYAYDQRGRQVRADDPDTGISTRTYDSGGRLATTTDARNQTLANTYDLLGRRTGTYSGTVTPTNQLTGFLYDTVAKGQATSSTRYVGGAGGNAFTKAVAEVDVAYRATRTTVTIPGSEIGATGQVSFEYTAAYDPVSGAMVSEGRAPAGNLVQEYLTYNYETYGTLNSMGGAGLTYLRQADWDAYGRNIRATMNPWGIQVVTSKTYDEPTGRLLTEYVDKQTATTGSVQNTTYAYNQAGQITAIRSIPNNTPSATDLQCFGYDHLGRLTTAWTDTGQLNQPNPSTGGQGACANATPTSGAVAPAKSTVGGSAAYWQEYSYDLTGNRTKVVHRNPGGDTAKDLRAEQTFPAPGTRNTPTTAANTGGGTGGPHALATSKNTQGWSPLDQGGHQYDAAGNTTKIANPGGNKEMKAGFVLKSGETVRSNSIQLAMQADGNLVLTSLRSGAVMWSSNTQNHPGAWATMQDDGNFVVYDPQHVALWSSNTWAGNGSGYFAVVQDDGKFVVYAPGWASKWGTATWNWQDSANGATLTWDAEGKLASLTQGPLTTTYVYDAEGNQLVRRNPGRTTVNLGGGDELVYDTSAKTTTGNRYYALPGGTTLVRQGPTRLTYQFADHHGTNTLSIDSNTLNETRRPVDPFGVSRGADSPASAWAGDKGFVGGLKDDLNGFTNLGARQYQPSTGRFLSTDPLFDSTDPQQWNGYSYSTNNPVNRSDPSGLGNPECGTLYNCGSGSGNRITMANAAQATATPVSAAVLARHQDSTPGFPRTPAVDMYEKAKEAGFGANPNGSSRRHLTGQPGPDRGIVMARFYIHTKDAALGLLVGDDRGVSTDPNAAYRMAMFWNTATGDIALTVTGSVQAATSMDKILENGARSRGITLPDSSKFHPAKELILGESSLDDVVKWRNTLYPIRKDAAAVKVKVHGVNSVLPVFAVDNELGVGFDDTGRVKVTRSGDAYPDLEVVQYRQGHEPILHAQDRMASESGLDATPLDFIFGKIDKTWVGGTCTVGC